MTPSKRLPMQGLGDRARRRRRRQPLCRVERFLNRQHHGVRPGRQPAASLRLRVAYDFFARALAPYSSASGDVYASEDASSLGETEGDRVIHLDFPPPGPLAFPAPCKANPLGNTKATLNAEVNPEGKATTYRFQYIAEADFDANVPGAGGSFEGLNPATSTPESASIGSDFTLHKASAEINVVPETKYRCRVVASNDDAPGGNEGPEGTFTALDPLEIGATWSSGIGTEEATLNAEVNPLGIPTTGYFQYVEEATYLKDVAELGAEHGFDHASKAPAGEPIEFGAGEEFKAGSVAIAGLKAGTAYRYRIVATDPLISPDPPPNEVFGPTEALRTFRAGSPPPARRARLGAGLPAAEERRRGGGSRSRRRPLTCESRSVRIQAAAGSGEAHHLHLLDLLRRCRRRPRLQPVPLQAQPERLGDREHLPLRLQRRPAERPLPRLQPRPRLRRLHPQRAAAHPRSRKEGPENLYLRDNETGELQALTIEAPQLEGSEGFCTGYAGASADGSRAVFAAKGAMAGAPTGKGFSLYEWSEAEGLKLVSVLPDGSPAPPVQGIENPGPGNGTGFAAVGGNCSMGQQTVQNAISADGSTIFWTYGGKYLESEKPLFARINGTETIQLDAKAAGEKSGGEGRFLGATPEGTAFFTAPGKLTTDAKAKGRPLPLRLPRTRRGPTSPPAPSSREVQGVVGASEDGTHALLRRQGAR